MSASGKTAPGRTSLNSAGSPAVKSADGHPFSFKRATLGLLLKSALLPQCHQANKIHNRKSIGIGEGEVAACHDFAQLLAHRDKLTLVSPSVVETRPHTQLAQGADDGWHHAIRHDCKITDIRPFPPLASIRDAGSEAVLVENDLEGARREADDNCRGADAEKDGSEPAKDHVFAMGLPYPINSASRENHARNQQGQPFPSGGCEPEWAWKLCEQGGDAVHGDFGVRTSIGRMGGPRDMIGRVGRNAFPATLDAAPPIKAINSHRFTTTLN
jgi:hypothetical protein